MTFSLSYEEIIEDMKINAATDAATPKNWKADIFNDKGKFRCTVEIAYRPLVKGENKYLAMENKYKSFSGAIRAINSWHGSKLTKNDFKHS